MSYEIQSKSKENVPSEWQREHRIFEEESQEFTGQLGQLPLSAYEGYSQSREATQVWLNPKLEEHEATKNLDELEPATLYFLGRIKDIQQVVEVYLEEKHDKRTKHWTILSERDYDVMDEIYKIEDETLNKFPEASLRFRTTVEVDDDSFVPSHSIKIFERS